MFLLLHSSGVKSFKSESVSCSGNTLDEWALLQKGLKSHVVVEVGLRLVPSSRVFVSRVLTCVVSRLSTSSVESVEVPVTGCAGQ